MVLEVLIEDRFFEFDELIVFLLLDQLGSLLEVRSQFRFLGQIFVEVYFLNEVYHELLKLLIILLIMTQIDLPILVAKWSHPPTRLLCI